MKRYLLAAMTLSGMINIMGSEDIKDIEDFGNRPSSCTIESAYPLVCAHCGKMNRLVMQTVAHMQGTQLAANTLRCPSSVIGVQHGGVQKPCGARTAKAVKIKDKRKSAKNVQSSNE